MQKCPLIGVSIIAVVLLILASLTNVVGYQPVKSSNPHPIIEQVQKEKIQYSNTECNCGDNSGDVPCEFPIICAIVVVLFKIVFNLPSPFPVPPLLLFIIYLGALFACDLPYIK
jgi:hypothetical protein